MTKISFQHNYNKKHGIVPKTIYRKIAPSLAPIEIGESIEDTDSKDIFDSEINIDEKVIELEEEMKKAAEALEFERASVLRDKIYELKSKNSWNNA